MDEQTTHLARLALLAFVLAFTFVRSLVYLMGRGRLRNIFFEVKGVHVHHLNYGIFLLSGVGAYLIFGRPAGRGLDLVTIAYGIGMALTFDEFGMWLHLEDNYWQRASWDAMAVIGSALGLIAFAPSIGQFRLHHWVISAVVVVAVTVFFLILLKSRRPDNLGQE